MLTSKGCNHGPNLWQEHHYQAKDALRGCSKKTRTHTSIWDRWTNDQVHRESQLAHDWSDAFVRYLDHISAIDISQNATQEQRGRYHSLLHLRSLDDDRQGPPLATKPGYKESRNLLRECRDNHKKKWRLHTFQNLKDKELEICSTLNYKTTSCGSAPIGPRTFRKHEKHTLIFIFPVLFNIMVGLTIVVFTLARQTRQLEKG